MAQAIALMPRSEQVRRYVVNAVLTVLWCESALQRPRGASWTLRDI